MIFFRSQGKAVFFCAILFFCAERAHAKIEFSSPNLNEASEALFALKYDAPWAIDYSAIFKSKIKDGKAECFPQALTCFPESMLSMSGGKKLHVRNRYGAAIYDFSSGALRWNERAKSFPENSASLPVAQSASGKWHCSVERKGMFKGRLVITEIATEKKITLNENCELSYLNAGVKWSPDGENFVYEKNGSIYLCNAQKLFEGILLDEKFRRVCEGTINSVAWNDNENLTFISSDLIFQIGAKEIFSLGIYLPFVPLGKILGRLPQKFNGQTDCFWTNERASDFIVVRNSEILSWHKKNAEQKGAAFLQTVCSLSLLENQTTVLGFEIFFTCAGELAVCSKITFDGSGAESLSVSTVSADGKITKRLLLEDAKANATASPKGTYAAFFSGDNVFVYSMLSWKPLCQLKGERAFCASWISDDSICIGGERSVKKLSLSDFSVKTLFPSSAEFAWWTLDGKIAFKDSGGATYTLHEASGVWAKEACEPKSCETQNQSYRIFCGQTKNEFFENSLYVRTLYGKITTRSFVAQSAIQTAPLKKAALIFDADENCEGLNQILALCNEYDLKCAFFFNGEFIRRYPEETKKIATSRHDCGAIFFYNVDLLDKAVYSDKRFVSKGLARLEDEFLACTGKELSLFWHAPRNRADKKVREEGAAAGYDYVDVESPNVIRFSAENFRGLSNSAIYSKFHLFLNELFASGVELVSLSEL